MLKEEVAILTNTLSNIEKLKLQKTEIDKQS